MKEYTIARLCCGGYRVRILRDGKEVATKNVASAHHAAQWVREQKVAR